MEKTQTSVVFNIGPIMGLKRKNWAMLQACEYKLVQASGQSVGLHYTCLPCYKLVNINWYKHQGSQ